MSDLTIYRELEQRSDEWYAARCGLVTASAIGRLITVAAPGADAYECPECAAPPAEPCISLRGGAAIKTMHSGRVSAAAAGAKTADPVLTVANNDTTRGLIITLAAERITGRAEDGPMTSDMWRGVEHEPFARDAYVEHHAPVEEVGFMVRHYPDDAVTIGCSPDGLVGDAGGIEIKCPRAKAHVQTVLADEVPAQYMGQCQAFLTVSGRQWVDFVSFVAGMELYVKRVTPDPLWQAAILRAADHAERAIADVVARYQAAAKGLPMTDLIPDLIDTITF